jgi:micrococcal nuclease
MYRDEKNQLNVLGSLKGFTADDKVLFSVGKKDYRFQIMDRIDILNNFSDKELEEFSQYVSSVSDLFDFNIKITEECLIPKAEIQIIKEDGQFPLKQYIDDKAKSYIEQTRRNKAIKYNAKLISYTDPSHIAVETSGKQYMLSLDLFDTGYSLKSHRDKKTINSVLGKLLENVEDLKISTDSNLNFKQLSQISYKKNEEWISLNKEMKALLNPYKDTRENGKQVFKAIISRIIDGDTVDVFDGDETLRIRLSRIDAPESKQKDGIESTKYLTKLLHEEPVSIAYEIEEDDYERVIGIISKRNEKDQEYTVDVNKKMVEKGLAWATDSSYICAQNKARKEDLGMWLHDPVYPKDYRDNPDYYKKDKKKWEIETDKRMKKDKKKDKKSIFKFGKKK